MKPRGGLPRRKGDSRYKALSQRKSRLQREREYHPEEHEGHKVKFDCEFLRGLRVLRGRQVLPQVTGADDLVVQVSIPRKYIP